jgi:hypothetical protein
MDFLRRVGDVVGDALVGSDSDSDGDSDDVARGTRQGGGASDAGEISGPDDAHEGDDADELDELMNTAFTFGRSTLAKLKDVSKGVGKELSEGLKDIKEQVREDFATFGDDDVDEDEVSDIDADTTATSSNGRVVYTGEDVMIPGAGDEDVGDEDIALEVQEKFEQVGEKIELLGQKMFVGAGKLINQVKETTRDAIKETKEVIKETRDAFAVKDSGKTPKRGRDEFAIRVQAIQRDSGTYCDDPKNVKLFEHFSESFTMAGHGQDILTTLNANNFMKELFARIVPTIVDEDTFWRRYFFKLYELELEFEKQALPDLPDDSPQENLQPSSAAVTAVSHQRISSLATDEEGFDSDSSLAKDEWTKLKQPYAAENKETEESAVASLGETGSNDDSDDDEDWGMT